MKTLMDELYRVLHVLSSKPEYQIIHLQGAGGVSVDELALEFDDLWTPLKPVISIDEGIQNLFDALVDIDKKLHAMSADEQNKSYIWSEAGLKNAQDWQELRKLALTALNHFPKAG